MSNRAAAFLVCGFAAVALTISITAYRLDLARERRQEAYCTYQGGKRIRTHNRFTICLSPDGKFIEDRSDTLTQP